MTFSKTIQSNNDYQKEFRIQLSELIYLLYFAIMLGAKAIGLYEGMTAYNISLVIGATLIVIKLLLTEHSLFEYCWIVLFLLLGGIIYIHSGEKSLLIYVTMMVGVKDVSVRRVFKLGAIIWITSFVSIYVLSVLGVINEYALTLDRADWDVVLRHSLGYPHPNTLHVSFFVLTVFVIYLLDRSSKKKLVIATILLAAANLYVFMYSLSRTDAILTMLFLAINLYLHLAKRINSTSEKLLIAIYPVCFLISIFAPLILSGSAFDTLNRIFAGRLVYSKYYLTYQPLQMFGIRSIPVPASRYIIDSSYVYLVFRLGICAALIFTSLYILLIRDAVKHRRMSEIAILEGEFIEGITEPFLFNQSFKNLSFLFLGRYAYELSSRCEERLAVIVPWIAKPLSVGRFGRKELTIKIPVFRSFRRVPYNVFIRTAAIFCIVWAVVTAVYAAAIPVPAAVYIPEKEYTTGEFEEAYLSVDDVRALRREGNIIRGYTDETSPLYKMSGSIAELEHSRYTISYGLWTGAVLSLAFLIWWISQNNLRFFKRKAIVANRSQEYKETILITHNYYRIRGGEDVVVENEKTLLEQHGHKVILYTRHNDEITTERKWEKIKLAAVAIFNARTYRDIKHIIEKEEIDIIHVHNTLSLISPAVYLAGINMGIPVVQTLHNFRLLCPNGVFCINGHICEDCVSKGLRASLLKRCYRNSISQTFINALSMKIQRWMRTYEELWYIALTEFNRSKILQLKQIAPERVFVKPNFTNCDTDFVPYNQRKRQIVYVGRLEQIRGTDLLLQAWMKMGEDAPDLVLCGTGELDEWCKEYIDNNHLNNVVLKGFVSNADVKKIVAESMAMVFPTQWYEGFPVTIAEAFSVGTPVIASDLGNAGDLIEEGVSGYKFAHNSVTELVNAVEKLLARQIQEMPNEIKNRYSPDKNYSDLSNIYGQIIHRAALC